jgi:nucleoside-diphosphate-sugar epimerase
MRVLVIGGTGFIGPWLVRDLRIQGHETAVLHRGNAAVPEGASDIICDRKQLQGKAGELRAFRPDVVVDLILSSEAQARDLIDIFRGHARRVVTASSIDVYRAFGVLHGTEPGGLQPVPLTEESEVRSGPAYVPESLKYLESVLGWVDQAYDKVPAERVVMSNADLPGTVLRLPIIYGPGDPLHRLFPLLKRMDDVRARILFSDDVASWRGPRSYVENVAAALALAIASDAASNRIYNVAEETAFTELEWARKVAEAAGWQGQFTVLPHENAPRHVRIPGNLAQHWTASSAKIRRELGYAEPVSLGEALRRTIAWERANPPATVDPSQFDYEAEDRAAA